MRGATRRNLTQDGRQDISIHAPHARSDRATRAASSSILHFNPRSSCEERPVPSASRTLLYRISIHAPHARSDGPSRRGRISSTHFNPRSSCEERRLTGAFPANRGDFNPRSSCEERRGRLVKWHRRGRYFNPRSSCEERHNWLATTPEGQISIHAPHARSDDYRRSYFVAMLIFQSTLLMRGATHSAY